MTGQRQVIAVIAPSLNEARWAERLAHHGPGHETAVWPDVAPERVDYAAVWLPPPGVLAGLPNLKVVFNLGAGVDRLMADPELPDVPIVRSVDPDLTARMSEYVVLHALAHLRGLTVSLANQGARKWAWRPAPLASEVTVGIMGLGVLGQGAAEKLAAVGFRLAGWSRQPKSVPGISCHAGAQGLDDFLAETDILVCLLPATAETRGIIDAGLISRLRRDGRLGGPVLINAGRGAAHVEADIAATLADGRLRAASLDVFETEPLDPSSPLWGLGNLLITPHAAADSHPDALARNVMQHVAAYEAGGIAALTHLVDRDAGY